MTKKSPNPNDKLDKLQDVIDGICNQSKKIKKKRIRLLDFRKLVLYGMYTI